MPSLNNMVVARLFSHEAGEATGRHEGPRRPVGPQVASRPTTPPQPQAILPAGEPLEKSMARSKNKQKIKHLRNKQRTKRRKRARLAAKKSARA